MSVTSLPRVEVRFSRAQRFVHWLMAAMVIAMLFIGVFMVSTVRPSYLALVDIHRPLGIAILLLALVRLALRASRGAPPLPRDLPAPARLAAQISHVAFYVALFAMPLIGWGMVSAAGEPVVMWGGFLLPPILPPSPALHALLWEAHVVIAYLLFALVVLHISAALMHALIRRDGVWEAMAGTGPARRRGE